MYSIPGENVGFNVKSGCTYCGRGLKVQCSSWLGEALYKLPIISHDVNGNRENSMI